MLPNDADNTQLGVLVGTCLKCSINFYHQASYTHHILQHISCEIPTVSLEKIEVPRVKIGKKLNPDGTYSFEVCSNEKIAMSDSETADQDNMKDETTDEKKTEDDGTGDSGVGSPSDTKKSVSPAENKNPDILENAAKKGYDENEDDDEEEDNISETDEKPTKNVKAEKPVKTENSDTVKKEPLEKLDIEDDSDKNEKVEKKPVFPRGISVRKSSELLATKDSFPHIASFVTPKPVNINGSAGDQYLCGVCPTRFPTGPELESHLKAASHYVCPVGGPECASFSSSEESTAHQMAVHGGSKPTQPQPPPVQQLAQQVDRIPYREGSSIYPNFHNRPMLGSQVMLTPVAPSIAAPPPPPPPPPAQPSIPNLPGIQVTKRQANLDESPQNKKRREEPPGPSIRLPNSITLVRPQSSPKKDNVADILATRGITMMPTSTRNPTPPQQQPQAQIRRVPSQLNSSVSITPSNRQFAVPRNRANSLPTVDLTQEPDGPRRRPGGPLGRRLSCQVCDKVFSTVDQLQVHMMSHRTQQQNSKLPYECELCTAQYPTEQGLASHKQKFHSRRQASSSSSMDMALPVVDIRQPGVKEKLLQTGIRHVLMLDQLHNRAGTASFGLPIVPIDLANNQAFCSLGDMGASNILPLGPLQSLSNR